MLYRVLVVLSIFGFNAAQVEFRKPCPTIPPMQNFNLTEFEGNWFELARYDYPLVTGGECVTMNFKLSDRTVSIESTMRRKEGTEILKPIEKFNLVGEFRDKFVGTFNLSHPALAGMAAEHHIITTDYKGYALIWRCEQINSTYSKENAWLLARTRELKGTLNQTIEGYIKAILSPNDLHRTIQDEGACVSGVSSLFAFHAFVPVAVAWIFAMKNKF